MPPKTKRIVDKAPVPAPDETVAGLAGRTSVSSAVMVGPGLVPPYTFPERRPVLVAAARLVFPTGREGILATFSERVLIVEEKTFSYGTSPALSRVFSCYVLFSHSRVLLKTKSRPAPTPGGRLSGAASVPTTTTDVGAASRAASPTATEGEAVPVTRAETVRLRASGRPLATVASDV